MKMYKGFNKDMTCRDFQYEIGKTYETDEAKLCESGFHACEAPLDVFHYYAPATSQYCEVDLDDVTTETSDDTKRVGKKIKIGEKLSVQDLINAQFEYVRDHSTTLNKTGGSWSALTGGDRSALTGGYRSAFTGGDGSALIGGARSALTGGKGSALTGSSWSALTGGSWSALTGGSWSALTGGDRSALTGGEGSALTGGEGTIFRGGMWTVFATPHYSSGYGIVGMYVAVVDGENIKPDTWYTVKDGEWVEADDKENK